MQKCIKEMNTNLLPPSSLTLLPNWMCFPANRPRLARFITTLLRGRHFSKDCFTRGVKFFSPTFLRTFFIISLPLNAIFLINSQKQNNLKKKMAMKGKWIGVCCQSRCGVEICGRKLHRYRKGGEKTWTSLTLFPAADEQVPLRFRRDELFSAYKATVGCGSGWFCFSMEQVLFFIVLFYEKMKYVIFFKNNLFFFK